MLKLEVLISKFWSGTISHSELKKLEELLQQQQSGEGISALVGHGAGREEVQNSLDQEQADKLLKNIHINISAAGAAGTGSTAKKKVVMFRPRLIGIAASITLAVILSWLWMRKEEAVQVKGNKQEAGINVIKHTENKTDTIMNISLPDGSAAVLYPRSEISYAIPFSNNKRDITLTGSASFKVAADRSRPFTVYANGIATTALGTCFRVNAENKRVHVLLYEGRVVIHPATGSSHLKKAYLNPGQQLFVARGFDYVITQIQPATHLSAAIKGKSILHKGDVPAGNADTTNLSFNNTPLSDVFDRMAIRFNVRIICADREKLQQIPFTGYFNANDSLENLLKLLCGMNNLQYQLAGDEWRISNP